MNFGRAFSYVFQDREWFKKILLIAVISLIPVIGQMVAMGFALEIMKRVINNDPETLPALNFGGFLGKGFQAFIVSFVYAIPLFIFVFPTQIPTFLAGSLDSEIVTYLTIGLGCICGGLAFIYAILMMFMIPAAYAQLVVGGSLGAAFQFGKVFGLVKKAPVAYLVAILGNAVGSFIAPFGAIACGIGVFFTLAYSFAIMGHFYGQAYNVAVSK